MAEAMSSPDDDRLMELSSVAAIYPEINIDPSCPFRASLALSVAPSAPLHVCFEHPSDTGLSGVLTPPTSASTNDVSFNLEVKDDDFKNNKAASVGKDVHILSYLPPIELSIELPEGYPSEEPPIFKLTSYPQWLHSARISQLLDDGKRLWEEGGRDLIVYSYIDHLQQLAETAFGIDDHPDGEALLPRDLKIALLDFNNKAKREKFEQETFECGVCLEPKKGVTCHRMLRCSHVFCVPCLQSFYNSCITEGDVDGVKCLSPDCAKKAEQALTPGQTEISGKKKKKRKQTLSPSELLQIPLEQYTVKRYINLKRKKKLEADKSTVYCPRQWCQGAARSKKHPKPVDPMADDFDDSEEEDNNATYDPTGEVGQLPPMADRVAICEDCGYAFCSVCKKGWHGELERCFPRRKAEMSQEEKATEEYLRLYTSPCPTCNAPCQKQMGCNHMICFRCGTHFCYLCSSWLCQDNPYRHFNNINGKCYNRLWDMEGGDGIDPNGAEALHQIPEHLLDFDDDIPQQESDDDFEDDDIPAWDFDDSDDDFLQRLPPPPAPVPPQVNQAAGNRGNRQRGRNPNALDAAGRAAAEERQAQARAMAEVRDRGVAGRNQEVNNNNNVRPGLQRFLDLVLNDREDEWDSDELDGDF